MILATPISVCIQIIKYLNRAIKSMKSLLALFFMLILMKLYTQ